jgi:glycerol-3-phosphate dehydrogenase
MGQMVNRTSRDKIAINLSKDEITQYIKRFQLIDKENKGYVSINDIRRALKVIVCMPLLRQLILKID